VVDYDVYRYGERLTGKRFDADSEQIWLNDVQCVGNEMSIADCQHNGWSNHNCTLSEDVSVLCGAGIVTNSSQLKHWTFFFIISYSSSCHVFMKLFYEHD